MEIQEFNVSEIVYREDLYTRAATRPDLVQSYAEDIEVLPPIEINQNFILIDGWHRWTAHKKVEAETIQGFITETKSEFDIMLLSAERNNDHGWQMSRSDKQAFARNIYHRTPVKARSAMKERLQQILSVTPRTIHNWLSRIDKDTKKQQKKKVFDLWLACWTQAEVAEELGIVKSTVNEMICSQTENLLKSNKFNFQDEAFQIPLYNVWKVQNKSNTTSHPGNTEVQWLENLLYLYTDPFDIVIDPFAGGGSTIDVCKKRGRRYYVSDRKPIVEREHEIREHDLTTGLPSIPRWKDVKLVYLDPPYWKQSFEKYSNDPEDLANMELEQFHKTLISIIKGFQQKLSTGSYIALILQPTQWNAPHHTYIDHNVVMLNTIKLPVVMRIQCPYESQQCTAQMVEWAKANKQILVLSREIIVWQV